VLAVGLAMDAMAVAGARGLAAKHVRVRDALLVALFFGGFQAGMPVIGWALGEVFAARITGWGHWVTFVVLGGIGVKMIYEARGEDARRALSRRDLTTVAAATRVSPWRAGTHGLRVRGSCVRSDARATCLRSQGCVRNGFQIGNTVLLRATARRRTACCEGP